MARRFSTGGPENFNDILPRTIFAEADPERLDKTGASFTGYPGLGNSVNQMVTYGAGNNILRNPSRRFYDPEITTTAIYLPRTVKQKNRWCRWFYDHDELVGAVLDLHAELPYSRAEIVEKDTYVRKLVEECFSRINFFSMLPIIDLEFMKIGEVFIHTPWDDTEGMWSHIIVHNPDFAEVRFTPFADQECTIELIPDDELRSIVHSTKPEDQQLKRRIPDDVFRRVLTGKNITLDPSEVTHIARRSNPYDIRGTSIINRIFRLLMYEDKLREAQITIADNFIYPLKIFKLGDPKIGWIPNETHQRALAQMLQQSTFDPNFSLIYHYGLNVEFHTVADKVMRLEKEWSDITEKKMIALGVGKQFLSGETTYACFVEGSKILTPNDIVNIEDISNDDKILDKNGMVQTVVDNWCEGIPETITKINLWGGKELLCTNNHKWPVWMWPRKCACGCDRDLTAGRAFAHAMKYSSNYKLKKVDCGRATINSKESLGIPIDYESINKISASEIKEWDYLMIPRNFEIIETDTTKDEARLLGYFVTKGSFSKHARTKNLTGINLTFGITEENTLVKDTVDLCEKFGIPVRDVEEKTNSLRIRSIDRKEFKDKVLWFKEHAGEYSHLKKLSSTVMHWPLDLKEELVKGLFKGDGCQQINKVNNEHSVHYTTTSKVLAYQIELILAQLGFPINWTIQDNSHRNRKMTYRLDIYGKFAFDLAKLIWEDDCIINFNDSKQFYGQKAWVDNDYIYIMVKSVEEIKNDKKVYNLTVENSHSYLIENIGTYNSANVALQTQLARYKAKRDLFQIKWIHKMLRIMAERNEWYRRDKKELVGQYRVKRKGKELQERLIIPKLTWHKKLMMRDDQAFLTFMNNVYAQGKGPISTITLLQYMGLSLEDELENKVKQTELEEKIGALIHPITQIAGGMTAKIKDKFKFGKNKPEKEITGEELMKLETTSPTSTQYSGSQMEHPKGDLKKLTVNEAKLREAQLDIETTKQLHPVDEKVWFDNLESPSVPSEVKLLLINLNNKLNAIDKRNNGDYKEGLIKETNNIKSVLIDLYKQGKLHSYNITGFFPIYKQYYSTHEALTDYSDLVLAEEFEQWIHKIIAIDVEKQETFKHLRNVGNACFCYGQVKGYQEQGVNTLKIGNLLVNEGLRYSSNELLDKGWNLSSLLSPKNEIVILYPCIEGHDDDMFNNNLDPQVQRYRDAVISGIAIKDCPIEYMPYINRIFNKLGKHINKKYDTIVFVKDVIDLKKWEERKAKDIENEASSADEKTKNLMVINSLGYEKLQKRGTVPTFTDGRTLYISNWIGVEEFPLTSKLLRLLDITDEIGDKAIRKAFKKKSLDLTQDDIQTYRVFNYIVPISDDPQNPRGFKISKEYMDTTDLDFRLKQGKMWDLNGKCMGADDTDELKLFNDNLRIWIDYPHLLNVDLAKSFEVL